MPQAQRGELWLIDLGMVQKARPCLVLSIAYLDHERAVVSYVPRTTTLRGTRFEVSHQARGFEPGAFDAQGIGSIPVVKLERRLGIVEPAVIQQVETAVKLWLKLP
ncbi:MAG TPA: type II toxin-antitoxin system PemK/MazF family toxin [Candidatus Eisenbacteria bacterium]|nr:type II toxin-antitoxin system PemK/MazF family toxin [Candidatus Eisenbacteria bacterium]